MDITQYPMTTIPRCQKKGDKKKEKESSIIP
jgi:hypothetical protein